MKPIIFKICFFAWIAWVFSSVLLKTPAEAQADETNPKIVKNYRGLQFKVPEDWPIEKVGNTIGPIPIEDYMSRKFADLNQKLKKQEEAVLAIEKRLDMLERRKQLNA